MTKESPLVSIIIPIYNVEPYLHECLDSVVGQTYKNLEIILINDGSSDNSGKIAQEYAALDSRIKYIGQENRGAASARNIGLDICLGKYVLVFDGDDYMRLDAIEKLVHTAQNTKAQIIIAQYEEIIEPDKTIHDKSYMLRTDLIPQKETFSYLDCNEHIFGFCVGWAWDKLYEKDFIESNRLRFQDICSSDDLYFVFCSLVKADKISICKEMLFTHRTNRKDSMENSRDSVPLVFFDALKALKEELHNMGIYSNDIQKSFICWSAGFCLWHLETLGYKSHCILYDALRKYMLKELEIWDKDFNFFNDAKVARKIWLIKNTPLWLHKIGLKIKGLYWAFYTKKYFRIRLFKEYNIIKIFGYTIYESGKK